MCIRDRHNTDLNTGTTTSAAGAPMVALTFADNIVGYGAYGVCGTGSGCGNATINTYFPGSTFTHNVIVGVAGGASGNPNQYPPFHWFPTQPSAVGFADISTNNYHLLASSPYAGGASDGTDIGADIDSVNAHTNEVLAGYWPACTNISTGTSADPNPRSLYIFPNPAAQHFVLELPYNEPQRYSLHNADGRTIRNGTAFTGEPISVEELPNGTYFIRFDLLPNGTAKLVIAR